MNTYSKLCIAYANSSKSKKQLLEKTLIDLAYQENQDIEDFLKSSYSWGKFLNKKLKLNFKMSSK